MSKPFKLNEVEQRALNSMTDLSQIHEYGLKNLNVVRLNPAIPYTEGDTEISFDLSASKLAGNVPLNRVQMVVDYEVVATGDWKQNYEYVTPTDPPTLADFPLGLIDGNVENEAGTPYLFSVTNSGLDSLVVNKSFSAVQIAFGSVNMQKESRTAERLDILSRLLSQNNLIEAGLYPDNNYGTYLDKAGGNLEIVSLLDPQYHGKYTFAYGCGFEKSFETIFAKRNLNNQYIQRLKYIEAVGTNDSGHAQFSHDGGSTWHNSDPNPTNPLTLFMAGRESYFNINMYRSDPANSPVGTIDYIYDVIPAGQFPNPSYSGLLQRQKFRVYEDLLHDVFTSKYMSTTQYRALPTPNMTFTFSISPNLNQLFKTSNPQISNVAVTIKQMSLNILTFNFGALDIVPRPYFVPYYTEKQDQQAVVISTYVKGGNPPINPIQYNQMPTYLLFYCQEPIQTLTSVAGHVSGASNINEAQNLNLTEIQTIELTINNDGGSALYKMNKDELRQRTLSNLNDSPENVKALFRRDINQCSNLVENYLNESGNAWNGSVVENLTSGPNLRPPKSYLDGMYLLKIGKDIRISKEMMSGLNVPSVFKFNAVFSNVMNYFASSQPNPSNPDPKVDIICNFTTVAFFPAYYQISPTEGLLKTQNLVTSEQQMLEMLNATNEAIMSGKPTNDFEYNHINPLMIGSGWFSALAQNLPKAIGVATKGAQCYATMNPKNCLETAKEAYDIVKDVTGMGRRRKY